MWPSVCGAYVSDTSSTNGQPRTTSQFGAVPAIVRGYRLLNCHATADRNRRDFTAPPPNHSW